MMQGRVTAAPGQGLGRETTLVLATACGVAVANLYYNQPLLADLERSFPGQKGLVDFVPTATQLGYATGIFLLVPLGDLMDRRKLILLQVAGLAFALLGAALAPTAGTLLLTSWLVGIAATLAQQILPLAAELALPDKRGATIGVVMSGLLCGILLARTVAGLVGHLYGWRAVFLLAIGLAILTGALLAAVLPSTARKVAVPYPALLRSLGTIFRDTYELRRATALQMALFASFSVVWTILALRLEQPPYGMGANIAGLFGLVGGAGVLMAPLAGKVADRRGPHLAITIGVVAMLLSWLAFGIWDSIVGLVIGVLLIDVGTQCSMVSNQSVIYAVNPEARSRINTIFVGGIFIGGSLGSAGATLCWNHGGWLAVCCYGGALVAIAALIHMLAPSHAATASR